MHGSSSNPVWPSRLLTHESPRAASNASAQAGNQVHLPAVSRPLLAWFRWYARRYVGKHFHSVRLSLGGSAPAGDPAPLVIYLNHASWWDPMVVILAGQRFFKDRTAFGPIDAAALNKYKFFARLGFFPVEQGTRRGAAQFLRSATAVLRDPDHLLWMTPQGEFVDPRERPVRFRSGLGHLPGLAKRMVVQPLAIEYAFWNERLPEVLLRFGEPISVYPGEARLRSSNEWLEIFEAKLQQTQDALADESRRRDPGAFEDLLKGGAGVGGVYDLWRRLRAGLRGESFNPEHSGR